MPCNATVSNRWSNCSDDENIWRAAAHVMPGAQAPDSQASEHGDHVAVRQILQNSVSTRSFRTASDRIDRVVLHPVIGPLLLAAVLFLVFQAVFAWATVPMDELKPA